MGLFWNWNKHKAVHPSSEHHEEHKKEHPVHPAVQQPADTKAHPHLEHHAEVTQQKAPAVEHEKPHVETDMKKFVFRLSSHEHDKCALFIKEIIHRVNRHDWHELVGRIGKHTDGIKMRIDVKGKHDDIQHFIAWCKVGHSGVHMYEVTEHKAYSMPYSGYPPFKEQLTSWMTT